ncbi:hypothetical protein D5F11_003985 [Siminovitchia terrae]|uniref:Uncharacterized protein n=1 Tax=Siminovitchia terrae TaxID=1914933 RepID=A0A429XCM2_SIMTE|nr:hypothetical protein [Siminovitchia terrae]RST61215.1 hypothetical protein D5F11_003985 [Siminovitchia terrae]
MNIENLFINQVTVDDEFNYKVLYNDSRGAGFKDEYKALIREAISKKVIIVEKFIIAENIQDELYEISDTKGFEHTLIECLKNYHNEPDYLISPFIYILKKLDPNYTLGVTEDKLKIVSNLVKAEIRPRIDGKNAEPRLFFPNEKVAISSTNDNVENLGDILSVKDIIVYIIGTNDRSNTIYAYKVSRSDKFFEVARDYLDSIRPDLFNKVRKFEI